ncbi:radical SAM protein [Porticoccus sp. GXU_MW_L64]
MFISHRSTPKHSGFLRQLFGPTSAPTMAQPFTSPRLQQQAQLCDTTQIKQSVRHHCHNPVNALLDKSQPQQRLARELNRPGYHPTPITLGLKSDPYRVNDNQLATTRQILELLLAHKHPVHIITKSHLIVKDLDILTQLAKQRLCTVELCLHTMDSQLSRKIEPRTSSPAARLKTIGRLSAVGIPVAAMVAPLIPVVNDAEMEALLTAAQQAGAIAAGYEYLNLPTDLSGEFDLWLQRHYPEQAERIFHLSQANLSSSAQEFARMVQQRFQLCCHKLGLSHGGLPALDTTRFQAARTPG